jgi:hypothetical protein
MEKDKYISRQVMNTLINEYKVSDNELESFFNDFKNNGYIIEGFNEPKPSTVQKIGSDVVQRGRNILQSAEEAGQATGVEKVARTLQFPLRVAGQTAGAVGDVVGGAIGAGLEKTGLDKPLAQGIQKVAEMPVVKGATDLYGQLPQEVRGSIGDVANIATVGAGGSVAKTGARVAGNVAEDVAKGVKLNVVKLSELSPIGKTVTPEQAVTKVKENLLSQIEGKKSTLKGLDKAKSDILDTVSKDTRYHPEIDIENRTFNTTNAVAEMNKDISLYSEQLQSLFKKADETQGLVPLSSLEQNIASTLLNPKNKSTYVVAGKNVFADTGEMISRAKQVYGNEIPREEIWNIRKQIDQNIEKITDTDIKKNLRLDVRRAFADTLENSVGDSSSLVKRGMEEISKIIEARDYSRDLLNGSKISGGKLTDIIRNATASSLGQSTGAVGGGLVGGIGGAVVGYTASRAIGNWLARNTLSTSAERKALQNLIKKEPSVFKEIEDYIQTLSGEEKASAVNNIKKLDK